MSNITVSKPADTSSFQSFSIEIEFTCQEDMDKLYAIFNHSTILDPISFNEFGTELRTVLDQGNDKDPAYVPYHKLLTDYFKNS